MKSWVPVSATAAPIVLMGGWLLAGPQQPAAYSPVHDSISALAKHGAHDPGLMITALVVGGLCHLATAVGLPEVGVPSRIALAVGGLALIGVGLARQPNVIHPVIAAVGFVAFIAFPALSRVARPLGRRLALGFTIMFGWLVWTIVTDVGLGLSERALSSLQGLCPLLFVVLLRARPRPDPAATAPVRPRSRRPGVAASARRRSPDRSARP